MKIGILGGGQLSRMLALASLPLGLEFYFYEPNEPCCAAALGSVTYAEYDDYKLLQAFAEQVDLITYENENIPVDTLGFLERYKPVYPDKNALQVSQDRLLEKNLFQSLQIPTAPYFKVNTKDELQAALDQMGYPAILKSRQGGYDGKGQLRLYQPSDLDVISHEQCQDSIVEGFVSFDREISMIAARNIEGETVYYDLCENQHKDGILHRTINQSNDSAFGLARDYMDSVLTHLNYVGVLTLEFFQKDKQLIANEMAPRVHNSGHWTIEGSKTSQFENHLRCIMGLKPGPTDGIAHTVMYNLIGQLPTKSQLFDHPDLHLHDYQKSPRQGRKLGHITLLSKQGYQHNDELERLLEDNLDFFIP